MSKFNLMHCVPHPRMHGLNGYMEVIESVEWGLSQLGHEVGYSLNKYHPSAINIIFGAQVLPLEFLKQIPSNSIVYNFEQLRGLQKEQIRPEVHYYAEHFQIWDYSIPNIDCWKGFGVDNAKLVPVGYAPVLTRIPKCDVQDIDVLIYGLSGEKRLNAFHDLSHSGLSIVFASGLYGDARDTLISRAKVVLNINLYDSSRIFEIVRVSYLLANKKAVVAILDGNTFVEKDVNNAVKFTTMEKLVADCVRLVDNDKERRRLEKAGYEAFAKRDIKEILEKALG